jgi:hypothetical protein
LISTPLFLAYSVAHDWSRGAIAEEPAPFRLMAKEEPINAAPVKAKMTFRIPKIEL